MLKASNNGRSSLVPLAVGRLWAMSIRDVSGAGTSYRFSLYLTRQDRAQTVDTFLMKMMMRLL
jgi:hypothetical protein